MFTIAFIIVVYCCSAQHQQMVRTFWHMNRIRNPKTAAHECSVTAPKVSSDDQKVGHTILQDYQNDIKKRFRNGNAPLQWTEWLESKKMNSKRTAVKPSVEESVAVYLPNVAESFKLQASEMPSSRSSALSVVSSASTLAWRMEAFLLSSEDYQRYTHCSYLVLSYTVLIVLEALWIAVEYFFSLLMISW